MFFHFVRRSCTGMPRLSNLTSVFRKIPLLRRLHRPMPRLVETICACLAFVIGAYLFLVHSANASESCVPTTDQIAAYAGYAFSGHASPWLPLATSSRRTNQLTRRHQGTPQIRFLRGVSVCKSAMREVSADLTERSVCPWRWESNIDSMGSG